MDTKHTPCSQEWGWRGNTVTTAVRFLAGLGTAMRSPSAAIHPQLPSTDVLHIHVTTDVLRPQLARRRHFLPSSLPHPLSASRPTGGRRNMRGRDCLSFSLASCLPRLTVPVSAAALELYYMWNCPASAPLLRYFIFPCCPLPSFPSSPCSPATGLRRLLRSCSPL